MSDTIGTIIGSAGVIALFFLLGAVVDFVQKKLKRRKHDKNRNYTKN